ncbi:MAG: acetyl-CoA carboxylase biotin carboxylase subunit [Papillibacter sp.]|jgi:acetyl-CoA carboxylase biotin carboxylase subunit|nr:acetyl-CoA carboxylase biotin carboxylase subunit [Papillibacter sp.]
MYSKILIANRGEIAVRIIRACKEMGIATVAVYSQADADALHVALAEESFCIGRAEASDSYLNIDRIISAALVSGAQAIHPGYGFLSENADFARACRKNGLVFIGPSPDNMEKLSDKEKTKALMAEAGLRVIPGSKVLSTVREALEAAKELGYPIMLKARSGGGGRGIRLVKSAEELEGAFNSAAAEAKAAFSDGAIYIEKYINPARHVEIQILADEAGNVVCLGERDCSIQRKNQKLIEESPSPAVTPQQRKEVFAQAAKAVKKIGYVGAGTLEFLYDSKGMFYFMEMNVRLQVEHPVTEALTGIDLVKWQIRVASGIPLSFTQKDIDLSGSAIECRINALSPGKVEFMHIPGGPFVRFDTFLMTGTKVTPYYDSLLGKLIIYAGKREEALRKMKAALCELVIDGVCNNIEEQIEIISSEPFMKGSYNLDYFNKP